MIGQPLPVHVGSSLALLPSPGFVWGRVRLAVGPGAVTSPFYGSISRTTGEAFQEQWFFCRAEELPLPADPFTYTKLKRHNMSPLNEYI